MAPTTNERTCTIYAVVYPDDRRRASGETKDEAYSRAYFDSPGDAASFWRHNGGTIVPEVVTLSKANRLRRLGLLGRRRR